jgi:hypothetical protein
MKKPRHADQQIAQALRQAEPGTAVAELCRELGVSETTSTIGRGGTPAWSWLSRSSSSRRRIDGSSRPRLI